jgi:hypothetical protein
MAACRAASSLWTAPIQRAWRGITQVDNPLQLAAAAQIGRRDFDD